MAKSLLRLEALKLRKKGISVKKIARVLGISTSTASKWTRDIILTVEQYEQLKHRSIRGGELGRLKGAIAQKQRRLGIIGKFQQLGAEEIKILTKREFLVAGLTLYWGEGGKTNRRVELCNSDPKMIKFFTSWLTTCFGVQKSDFMCRVGINQIHVHRECGVRQYWSNLVGVSPECFRKTSFKKVVNKKIYENFDQHYGTLSVRVAKSSRLFYKIAGLVKALGMAA